MPNIMDYLDWRGDLPLSVCPFNEVDSLILSELAYFDFTGLVPSPKAGGNITLEVLAKRIETSNVPMNMGVLISEQVPALLKKAAKTRRFSQMKLSHFVDHAGTQRTHQFSAVTFDTGDKCLFLAFRGTDDTLAGWKEDFLMSCKSQIPAQELAVAYVTAVANSLRLRKLRMGGHSKGGNLAVYGGAFCAPAIQKRIIQVYSNDGPGFHRATLALPAHQQLASRVFSIVPESSIVGMFMQHEETYTVVKSTQRGLMQHDGFSWEVMGNSFVHLKKVSKGSQLYDEAMEQWLNNMTSQQLEQFVETLFQILTASGAETLSDLRGDGRKSISAMAKAIKEMDKETRSAMFHALRLLFRSNLKVWLDDLEQELM